MMMRVLLLVCAALWLSTAIAPEGRGEDKPVAVAVDKDRKTITVPCVIAKRKLPNFKEIYPIEVIATYPAPKGKKAHETVVTFDVKPSEVHKALEALGLKPGKPVQGEGTSSGPEVEIFLEYPDADGKAKKVPIEETLEVIKTGKTMPRVKWLFTGSVMTFPDPEKDDKVYGADVTGTLLTIFPVTNETVFQTNLTMKEEGSLKLEVKKGLPKEGTPVKLIIQAK